MQSRMLSSRLLCLAVLIAILAACGQPANPGSSPDSGGEGPAPTEAQDSSSQGEDQQQPSTDSLTKVRMSTLPYFDYTGFVAAHELKLDHELGIELEFVPFPVEAPSVQALARGDIDIAQGALGSFVPILPQAQDLRIFLNNNQFKGFIYIGREGKIKPFEEVLKEHNGDFEAAQQETLKQFEGKTVAMVKSSFEPILKATVEQAGLTLDDVTVLDFANDGQAATAFIRGEGDLYIGSLPQEIRLLNEEGFIAVAGNEALGSAGLWFSNTATTNDFLQNNKETVLKLIAIYYRTIRYMHEKEDVTIGGMVEYLNQQAATEFTIEDGIALRDEFEDFPTFEEAQNGVYNPESPIYWKKAANYFVEQNVELGKIPADSVDIDTVVVQEQLFKEFLNNKELVEWVQSPLK